MRYCNQLLSYESVDQTNCFLGASQSPYFDEYFPSASHCFGHNILMNDLRCSLLNYLTNSVGAIVDFTSKSHDEVKEFLNNRFCCDALCG